MRFADKPLIAVRFLPFLLAAFLLLCTLSMSAYSAAPPVEAFARLPTFADMAIAPSGRFLAARMNRDNRYTVRVFDTTGSGLKAIFGFSEDQGLSIDWFYWLTEDHLLMSVAFSSQRGSLRRVKTQERRLVTLHAPTKSVFPLFRNFRGKIPVQIQDRIVSFLPDEPDYILVEYSPTDPARPNVYKVKATEAANHKRVQRNKHGVLRWMSDASGDVRLGSGVVNDKNAYLTIRPKGQKKWIDFSHRANVAGVTFDPVGFSSDPNKLYVTSNHEGDPSGLYLFDIRKDEFGELIFKHPTVDISYVGIDEKTAELRYINFVEDTGATKHFSRSPIDDDIDQLRDQHPGEQIITRSVSSDEQHAVLLKYASNDAGQFMLYDGKNKHAKQLPHQYESIAGTPLGKTTVTEYAARDGLIIPAFITLPPGLDDLDDLKSIPFVLYPHGGPASRDFLRFSYTVQFLVSRGYGVLQMNFRGSEGYGQAFRDAGSREWGQAMQDDITDGARWLISSGYADPERMAIAGGSYGGYAALMGAVKTPDLYQCAVSFAGVSDLPELIRRQKRYVAGSYATRYVGELWKDRKMLAANSPARRAEEITIPILLLHGDKDTTVDIDQSEKMAKALRKHNKEFEYVVLEDGDHHRSLYSNRLKYLTEVEQFLATCLN